jgi:pimeloyl-ACP methyl ester carboxylesterase
MNDPMDSEPVVMIALDCVTPVRKVEARNHVLQTGVVLERTVEQDHEQRYFLYIPRKGGAGTPVFISVHGISGNAQEHAERFAPFAEQYGVVLIAPSFPSTHFPAYQRLARPSSRHRNRRADHALQRIVAEIGVLTGAATERLYLFGYSGGGQFVHRYAMIYPDQVARYVVGAAGWYTFPDPTVRYPRGIQSREDLPDIQFDPRRFLTVPGSVLVGERDVRAGTALNTSPRIEQQQGPTRLERGKRWAQAMTEAAQHHHLDTRFDFQTLPGSGHSFRRSMTRGNLGTLVFERLFESDGSPR